MRIWREKNIYITVSFLQCIYSERTNSTFYHSFALPHFHVLRVTYRWIVVTNMFLFRYLWFCG